MSELDALRARVAAAAEFLPQRSGPPCCPTCGSVGWQPIETAPEGDLILVWYEGEVLMASKRSTKRFGARWSVFLDEEQSRPYITEKTHPTHWMPQPAPPE